MTGPSPGPVWVVLPTYDEAENVVALLDAVLGVVDRAGIDARLLVVDDGSPDGTAELAEAVGARDPRVSVLRRDAQGGHRPGLPRRLPPRARRRARR